MEYWLIVLVNSSTYNVARPMELVFFEVNTSPQRFTFTRFIYISKWNITEILSWWNFTKLFTGLWNVDTSICKTLCFNRNRGSVTRICVWHFHNIYSLSELLAFWKAFSLISKERQRFWHSIIVLFLYTKYIQICRDGANLQ